jgi:hypothetical protein
MKIALLAVLLISCSGAKIFRDPNQAAAEEPPDTAPVPKPRFTNIDASFKGVAHGPSIMVLTDDEMAGTPPFRAVGVLEMEGKETKRLKAFYEAAAQAGGDHGCDVLFQRDAFELGTRVSKPRIPIDDSQYRLGDFMGSSGRDWHRSDQVVWQFICGVVGTGTGSVSDRDQAKTLRVATTTAVELRRKQLGDFEPCDSYVPLGSHIPTREVCMEDPNLRRDARH